MTAHRWPGLALALALPAAPALAAAVAAPEDAARELRSLYERRDLFALRDHLAAAGAAGEPAEGRLYRLAVAAAFNDPGAEALAAELLATPDLTPALAAEARRLAMTVLLRRGRYATAADEARALLAIDAPEAATRRGEARSTLPLLAALAGAPPPEVEIRGPSRLALGPTGRLPIAIGGAARRFALDTGANLSVIARSEAAALGLEIRPAAVEVATSTGGRALADVAVAPRLTLGRAELRHVAFLVFPDAALALPGGDTLPGLLGFPVVAALGEVRFRRDGVLEVPAAPPRRRLGNLALDGLELLVRARWGGDDLVCRLDTGAPRTAFYAAFHDRHRERLEALGHRITTRLGGVGGERELAALRLQRMDLEVAAATATLRDLDVYSEPLGGGAAALLDCNLGLDALRQFDAYVLNLRDMALLLE